MIKKEFQKFYVLFVRGFKQALRPYLALMPEFVLPIFYFVVNSSAFQKIVDLPGFNNSSYLQFYAPVALLVSIFMSSGSTGLETVTDISTGFMDRIFLAPVNRWYIVISKLAAVGVKTIISLSIMVILLILFGASFHGGIIGFFLIFLLAFIFAVGWAGIGLSLAFITKNPRILQSAFIFFFPFSFITTSQLPLNLLTGWYKVAVQVNPVTYILEAMRSILINNQIGFTVFLGFIVAIGFALITLSFAMWSFKKAVVR
jgi:ABC-2 type transport system permease protein